jgi:hypothetical protein
MSHTGRLGRLRCQFVSGGNLRAGVDEEEFVDTFQRRLEVLGTAEIANEYIDSSTETRTCPLGLADENAWPFAAFEQIVDDLRPYVSRRPCNEVDHGIS